MSREQLTDQQAEHGTASAGVTATEDTYGLPPHIHGPLMRMGPGDSDALKDLLINFPGFKQQILSAAVAASHMGNIAIQRAIDMAQKGAVGRPGGLTQQQIGPGGEFELEGSAPAAKPAVVRPGALTQQQIGPGGEFELEGSAPAKPAAEPAWAGGARRYNEAHAELVSEFNDLTQGSCKGDGGQLDPQAVARWQRQHGVDADGRVGPHTLAAARHVQAKAGPAGAQDARIPV
jgi:peptidoglycan hydrolase-like protein with peptidoglycan-binding domain